MRDRPVLDHAGRQYERNAGCWLDRRSRLVAPYALSRELDRKAKADPDFWETCRDQDFADDPKNIGRVRLPAIHIPGLEAPEPRATRSPQRTEPAKRQVPELTWSFAKDRSLKLTSDLRQEWRATESSWCVRSTGRIELPHSYRLRTTLTLIEDNFNFQRRHSWTASGRPAGDKADDLSALWPEFDPKRLGEGAISVLLEAQACACTIVLFNRVDELNPDLPWRWKERHWQFEHAVSGLYERPIRPIDDGMAVSRPFRLALVAVLHPPPPEKRGPEYERDTPFPSAGLPSLGKRR